METQLEAIKTTEGDRGTDAEAEAINKSINQWIKQFETL